MNFRKLLSLAAALVAVPVAAEVGTSPVFAAPANQLAAVACKPETVSVHCGKTPTLVWHQDSFWAVFAHQDHIYVSRSADGISFSGPVAVNPEPEVIDSNGESRPKIVATDQAIIVSWTQKTSERYTGAVRYSHSADGGKTFARPRTINPGAPHFSQRFDSLTATVDGTIYLAWLDKRHSDPVNGDEPNTVSALYFAASQDHGKSFSKGQKVSDSTCECCRLATAAANMNELAIMWRHVYPDSIRDHAFAHVSSEGKVNSLARATVDDWQIEACPHHGPDMAAKGDGDYHLAWFSNGRKRAGIYYGAFQVHMDEARTNQAHTDQLHRITTMDTSPGASHPQVLEHAGVVFFAWKRFDGTATSIQLSFSVDGGHSWTEAGALAETQAASDHPLLTATPNGAHLSWHTQREGLRLINLTDATKPAREPLAQNPTFSN